MTEAIKVTGRFTLSGNHVSGFDEPASAALVIGPDGAGRPPQSLYLRNTFEHCAVAVREMSAGLWQECVTEGNLFIDCGAAPDVTEPAVP